MNSFSGIDNDEIPEEIKEFLPGAPPPPSPPGGPPQTEVVLEQLVKNNVIVDGNSTHILIGNSKKDNEKAIKLLEKEDNANPSSKVSNNLGCAYCWREKHTGNMDFANAKNMFYKAIEQGRQGSENVKINLGLISILEQNLNLG